MVEIRPLRSAGWGNRLPVYLPEEAMSIEEFLFQSSFNNDVMNGPQSPARHTRALRLLIAWDRISMRQPCTISTGTACPGPALIRTKLQYLLNELCRAARSINLLDASL